MCCVIRKVVPMLCVFTVQDGTKDHTNIHYGCKACARKVHSERGAPKARSEVVKVVKVHVVRLGVVGLG